MGNYKSISLNYLFTGLIVFILILIPILQRTFVLYQKQKLLNKTLKEYETELSETKLKLNTALEEKYKLVKTNHEFYHRQEALKQKLDNISSNLAFNPNLEISEDFGNLLDRINNLSEEYTSKLKPATHLPKTKIIELDDMFSYMQSECEKYKIEFILKISNDLNYMIENIIPKNKLETLIGDLIRNSIIAINNNTTNYKSIMVILGFKDNFYEFSVHDSGVEFNVDTLVKLGTKPITTHKDDGGTGIGFITTFETLSSCKGSLIITENIPSDNYYTKSICIKFDNKNNYIINSYRTTEINNLVDSKRNIIINKINN